MALTVGVALLLIAIREMDILSIIRFNVVNRPRVRALVVAMFHTILARDHSIVG